MLTFTCAECHIKATYAEGHYAECRYAECRGAIFDPLSSFKCFAPSKFFIRKPLTTDALLKLLYFYKS